MIVGAARILGLALCLSPMASAAQESSKGLGEFPTDADALIGYLVRCQGLAEATLAAAEAFADFPEADALEFRQMRDRNQFDVLGQMAIFEAVGMDWLDSLKPGNTTNISIIVYRGFEAQVDTARGYYINAARYDSSATRDSVRNDLVACAKVPQP